MQILRSGAFWVIVFGVVVLVGCKSAEQKEADKADLEKLSGTWVFSSKAEGEKDEDADDLPGDEKKEEVGTTYEIEKDVLTYRFNGEPYRWQRITIDASKDPKTIELLEVDDKGSRITTQSKKQTSKKGKTKTSTTTTEYKQLGVYKIDGDTLTLTLGGINVKTRPTEVSAKTKGSYTLVLKKKGAKGGDKAPKADKAAAADKGDDAAAKTDDKPAKADKPADKDGAAKTDDKAAGDDKKPKGDKKPKEPKEGGDKAPADKKPKEPKAPKDGAAKDGAAKDGGDKKPKEPKAPKEPKEPKAPKEPKKDGDKKPKDGAAK